MHLSRRYVVYLRDSLYGKPLAVRGHLDGLPEVWLPVDGLLVNEKGREYRGDLEYQDDWELSLGISCAIYLNGERCRHALGSLFQWQ